MNVSFGLANPAAYNLIYGEPAVTNGETAGHDGYVILEGLVTRIAQAGQLRMSVPHAVRMLIAAGSGVTLSLNATPPAERDAGLSISMREAVIAAITFTPTSDEPPSSGRLAAHAVSLRVALTETPSVLSLAERQLLGEWLDRLSEAKG